MTRTDTNHLITLNDDRTIPQLGFGVFQVPDEEAVNAVETALDAGYRHIDTAAVYKNERGVGAGIVRSGLTREQVFVTTKLWNTDQGTESVRAAIDHSCELLGSDFVDLYLIHWPAPTIDKFVPSWRVLVELREEGRARSIGVSNFHAPHLARVIEDSGVVPAVNQIELHPYMQQRELRAEHARLGIATEAWSPLGQGGELLQDPVLVAIAKEHESTPAQIVLAWHLAIGNIVIPKSVHAGRIAQNFNATEIELTDEQVTMIDGLDRGAAGRIGPDPDTATL